MNRHSQHVSLPGAIALLISLAALGTFVFALQYERALVTTDRYGQLFHLNESQSALLRIHDDIARHDNKPDRTDYARLEQQFYALDAQLRESIPPPAMTAATDLSHRLIAVQAILNHADRSESGIQIENMLTSSASDLSVLASAVYRAAVDEIRHERKRLAQLYWASSMLIPLAIGSCAWLIATLLYQRRHAVDMALHDQLTGLPNRLLFRRRLEEMLQQPTTQENGISVMFLDLDDFKDVNDSLGHVAGDALLCALTSRLLDAVPTGVVARLGGDEFAVLLPKGGRTAASELAGQLTALLSAPVELPSGQASTSVSIGIATRKRGGDDAISLLQQADLAMYEAKGSGRGSYHFFDEALSARLQIRMALEADMRDSLDTDQFHIAYQPLISLDTHRITGFEALLRWSHPVRGPVSPATFIPVAETAGLIVQLGEFVLRQACREAARWPGDVKVAVNLSPRQFKIDLVKLVRDALAESGLSAQRLELEITESALLQDGESVQATLHALRALGVKLALDDFGTGYSSLSYLQRYPFDKIKVDQSFVRGMSQRPESAAIVELISALARRLGMTTTAEGIETSELLQLVSSAGCTEGQGYYFDRPLRPEDAFQRLQSVEQPVEQG